MSPWPRERIMAWLSPHGVVLARQRPGLRLGRAKLVAIRERALPAAGPMRDAVACIAALHAELAESEWTAADVAVCLSDHFVRYALLPWRQGLRGYGEWAAYAAHELGRQFGPSIGSCVIRVSAPATGASRLAAAIDESLLALLQHAAGQLKLRLLSVEPNLCRATRRFHRKLQRQGDLVVSEPGRLTWLSARDNCWTALQSVRAGRQPAQSLANLVAAARMCTHAVHAAIGPLWLWGELGSGGDAPLQPGVEIARLDPPLHLPPACRALGLV